MIKFYATRDQARTAAKENGVTFKDMGKDAPKGERWAAEFPAILDMIESLPTLKPIDQFDQSTIQAANAHNDTHRETAVDKLETLNAELKAAFASLDLKESVNLVKPEYVTRRDHSVLNDYKGNQVKVITKRKIIL